MAISNQYIRDFLVNYWDTHGNLDGLSTNAGKVYQLIIARRKKDNSTKPVNDYIYSALGVVPRGNLGEELTFEINNYIQMTGTLSDIKSALFYGQLKRLADKYNLSVEEMLIEADYLDFLDSPKVNISYKNLNTYYALTSKVMRTILDSTPQIGMLIENYMSRAGSLNTMEVDEPTLFGQLMKTIYIPFGKSYPEDTTNADCIVTNRQVYFKDNGTTTPDTSNVVAVTKEIIYAAINLDYFTGSILPPSTVYSLRQHLAYYKTLYNLYRVNPKLYTQLKTIYLNEGCFKSLANMLEHEGFYYPELSVANVQYIPCQDEKHIVFVSNQIDNSILMDTKTVSVIYSNDLEDNVSLAKNKEDVVYVAVTRKEGRKVQTVPLHMFLTGNIDTLYADGNLLNVSKDNLILPN